MQNTTLRGLRVVRAHNFQAVPYLEASSLMQSHPKGVKLSTKKPTVIVGPNGAGKSAFLKALALRSLSEIKGLTELDSRYFRYGKDGEALWSISRWPREARFLPGLECDTRNARAMYYRPELIPGNEKCATTAMMCGYFNSAREYMARTEHKSAGQACRAQLAAVVTALRTGSLPAAGRPENWSHPTTPAKKPPPGFQDDQALQVGALQELAREQPGALPLVLLDEPEQSLDTRAELHLWADIASVDCGKLQVIVATHSLYPLLHPKKFHIIEATPGYAQEVRDLVGASAHSSRDSS